ncbi:MAG: peptide chain release factor 2 [Candidatus Brocadiales bacterium]|nr:peptide chain release factor 2 [Candidatus Brocadiales bacterium]
MINELDKELKPLRNRLYHLEALFDLEAKEKELINLEREMANATFWENKEKAQETVKKLKTLKEVTTPLKELQESFNDIMELTELIEKEHDEEFEEEIVSELKQFTRKLERFELRTMLSGPDDSRNAYLSIHAGAGGTESCDWASMLLRMYCRWAEKNGYSYELLEVLPGEEAGIKRVTTNIKGEWAYGYLKSEIGVHRLVRISPFDANHRRHTSFAAVDVTPEVDDAAEIEIKDEELRVDTYRASGAGGQHVNKTSSAVRLTHIPTGIVVQCQSERSQHQNRKLAMRMLKAKLHQLREKEREKELAAAYDEKGEIAWGNQIRSYVLQPYTLVKDLRTGKETGNAQAVLDGEIEDFMETYLKWKMGK